jgi:hypothetical protein
VGIKTSPELPLPSISEQAAARSIGMRQFQVVAADYRIENGVLIASGPDVRSYTPGDRPQLVTDLARLSTGDDRAVLAFAHNWGLLGYRQLLMANDLPEDLRNDLLANARGDPLHWLRAHAAGVHTCLELLRYLEGNDVQGLEQYLRSFQDVATRFIGLTVGRRYATDLVAHQGDDAVPSIARWFISEIVSMNLVRLYPQLSPTLNIEQHFDALVDVVYWHLAGLADRIQQGLRTGEATTDGEVKALGLIRCKACRALIVRTDRRQKFCPPSPGSSESQCARRDRARRLSRKESA